MSDNTSPKQPLKLLHIPTSGVNEGGITRFILRSMEDLLQLPQMEVWVLSPMPIKPSLEARFQEAGFHIKVIPGRKRHPLAYGRKLWTWLKQEGFQEIHVHGSSSLMAIELVAARLAGVPVRLAHSHNITCDHPVLHRVLRPLFRQSYTDALACSPAAGHWLFQNRPFEVLYNGLDLERFAYSESSRQDLRQKLGLTDDQLLMGHVGHFNQQKNHVFLLSLFEKLVATQPNARLLLIGSGPLEGQVKGLALEKDLADKVFFLGNQVQVEDWYSAMDVFVLPSLYEGFSIVLAEAQTNGLYSLTSNGTPETVAVTGRVHFLPLEDEVSPWLKALAQIPRERQALTDQEKEALQVFDHQVIAQKLANLYQQLASTSK